MHAHDRLQDSTAHVSPTGEPGVVVRLTDHLERHGRSMTADEFNHIACQIMDLYHALRGGDARPVEDTSEAWYYRPSTGRVIFPWCRTGDTDTAGRAGAMYRDWIACMERLGLEYRKPARVPYPADQQDTVRSVMQRHVLERIAVSPAVRRIHAMGPALRGDMGRYVPPYVLHGQVKLGSDVDLLIELDPARESDTPSRWQLYVDEAANSGCPVYHLGEIPLATGTGEVASDFPAISFQQHLIQAHVFFPSRCDAGRKEAFLAEFGARLLYDKGDAEREESRLAAFVAVHWDITDPVVRRLDAPARGSVHMVDTADRHLVLKITLDAGTFDHERLAEHARYEVALIQALRIRGVRTPAVVPALHGTTANIDGREAIMLERFDGSVCEELDYPTAAAARALAEMHIVQRERPLGLASNFTYEDHCAIWLPWFARSRECTALPPELVDACDTMAEPARRYADPSRRARLNARCVSVHCHGDVKPRNVVMHPDGRVSLFDFDNAMHGPRLCDAIDGAIAFALAEQHVDRADFARFDEFLTTYCETIALTPGERADLPEWIRLCAVVQFTREITTWVHSREDIRRQRALAIAAFARAAPIFRPPRSPAVFSEHRAPRRTRPG